MSKYYIYCSNNQAYHALIHNSIMAKAMMRDDFKSDTAAYLSKDYIFVTKSRMPDNIRLAGVSVAYYGVALEVEFDDEITNVQASFVVKKADGSIDISETKVISEYDKIENCIGAFICGEIPITYLSGIVFDDEKQMQSFNKSSQDLWFPEELKKVWDNQDISEGITLELLNAAAKKVDSVLTEDEAKPIEDLVVKRNRIKAAFYYAIEATKEWNIGSVRANIDSEIIKYFDKNDELKKSVKDAFSSLGEKSAITFEDFLAVKDSVFEAEDKEEINYNLFKHIISCILSHTPVRTKISDDAIIKIAGELRDCGKGEGQEFLVALKTVSDFLNSNMDPDEALRKIGKYDVIRAFMMFLDQQENSDFLRRAATKLSQNERRYAYVMYGALNGMSEVERDYKSNRLLEYRLEEKIFEKYPNDRLINTLPVADKCEFLKCEKNISGIGIIPSIDIWYDEKSSQEVLLSISDEKILEKIYRAMVKTVKDDPIPEQDIYSLKKPIMISIKSGEETIETFEIKRKKDAKAFGKKVEKALKNLKEDFNMEGFKKYLKDEKRYHKFYRKNTDLIQECCRKAK